MGICYYGVCHDCKKYINLDKFWWNVYEGADHCTIDKTNLEDYKEDGWIYRALRLHVFMHSHNGHRVGVYSENDIDDKDELDEQYPWPSGFKHLVDRIDMSPFLGRLIINTRFGEIFIDDRGKDINCFRFINGKRVDSPLLSNQHSKVVVVDDGD